MQIQTRFKENECKFEQFNTDSNHLNANLKHLNKIRSNRMQIPTIQKGFYTIQMQLNFTLCYCILATMALLLSTLL